MTDHYPLPSHAAYIWHQGDKLCIALPPRPDETKGHTISIPLSRCQVDGWRKASQSGWHLLLHILRERASAAFSGRLGTAGEDTQWKSDQILRGAIEAMSAERAEELRQNRAEAEGILRDAGVEL